MGCWGRPSSVGPGAAAGSPGSRRSCARAGLPIHGHPDGGPAPPTRPTGPGVDVVLLALPAVARARLDCVVAGLVEQGLGPVTTRSRSASATSAAGVQGPRRDRKSDSLAQSVPMPARLRWSSRAAPIVSVAARRWVRATERSQSGPRRSGPRCPTRVLSALVGTASSRPRRSPSALHVAVPTAARRSSRRSQRAVSAGASIRHAPPS